MQCDERDRLTVEYEVAADALMNEFGRDKPDDVLSARKRLEAARIALAEHESTHGC